MFTLQKYFVQFDSAVFRGSGGITAPVTIRLIEHENKNSMRFFNMYFDKHIIKV